MLEPLMVTIPVAWLKEMLAGTSRRSRASSDRWVWFLRCSDCVDFKKRDIFWLLGVCAVMVVLGSRLSEAAGCTTHCVWGPGRTENGRAADALSRPRLPRTSWESGYRGKAPVSLRADEQY